MKIYPILFISIMGLLMQSAFPQELRPDFFEYCFTITPHTTIGVARKNILPYDFLKMNVQVVAVKIGGK